MPIVVLCPYQMQNGREDIHLVASIRNLYISLYLRRIDDKRGEGMSRLHGYAVLFCKPVHLCVFAAEYRMVAGDNDCGVRCQRTVLNSVQQRADSGIGVGKAIQVGGHDIRHPLHHMLRMGRTMGKRHMRIHCDTQYTKTTILILYIF